MKTIQYRDISVVHETLLNIPLEYKEKCIEAIYNLKKSPVASRHNNFIQTFDEEEHGQVVVSNYHLGKEAPILQKLLDNIEKTIKHYVFPEVLGNSWDLTMQSSWAGIYENEGRALAHNHVPYFYSFVYYLKTDKLSSPMVFKGTDELSIQVKDDLLIFFPSHQVHYVPPNKGKDRVFIAGNVELKLNK